MHHPRQMGTSRLASLCTGILVLSILIPRCAAQVGVCYSTQSGYLTRYLTSYRSIGQSYTTSCDTFGWSRCSRTRYRSVSYSSSYSQLVYTQVSTCCSGYTGSPQTAAGCQAICSSGCYNGGSCNSPEVCSCANGWSGNTCATRSGGCFNGGVCTAPGTCTCASGWTGNDCRQDVNECALNIDNCDQRCVNDFGSYHCECYSGYLRGNNSLSCIDINECAGDHGCHHLCNNTDGSFHCYCDPGFMLDSDGITCEDINECLVDNGGCEFSCTNLVGIDGLPDISGSGSITNSESITNETNLGYQCGCDTGYQLAPNNHNCIDILNCLINDHNCSQICVELEGSFSCSCFSGYELQEDKANCADVDECARGLAGCSHNCFNTPGSFFCTCMDGFELLSDNRTCADIDECDRGIGGCQHVCSNTDGSYYCSCNDGYTLNEDGKYCTAQPCPFLMRPQNGYISCDGEHVTDTTCNLECDLGYGLLGSINRTCLPNNTWSGETTYCEILLCEELQNPENGSVVLPCGQEYGTICNIQCSAEFYTTVEVPVQICNATGKDNVEWTPAPACQENKLCTPNPCKHSGICNVTGPSYSCDCNGTRYTGTTCEIGIIETPDYPPLILSTRTKFTLFANPDYELIVQLSSSPHLHFSPGNGVITFTNTKSSADIFITGAVAGIYTVSYEISGKSSLQFQQPQPDIVIVQTIHPTPPVYFTSRDLESGMLEAGSCEYATPLPYMCPNEEDRISFSSTCQWHGHASAGIIFSAYKDLNIPVAIAGAKISTTDQSIVVPLTGEVLEKQCNFIPLRRSCTFKPSAAVQEIQNFLNTEALANTFLSGVEQLIPRWLQFSVISSANLRAHDSTSYMVDLVEHNSVSEIEECSNIFAVKDGMYSVLKYSGILNFSINSSSHGMISQGSPICFAVNLCEGLSSPLFITIPDKAKTIVNSLSFAQSIRNYGWEVMINSIVISSASFSHEFSGEDDEYWFGNQEETYAFLDSTIVVDGRFTCRFSLGSLQINYLLHGRAYMLYPNFDMVFELGLKNRWDGFMVGRTEIQVLVPIYSEMSLLLLANGSIPDPVLLSVGGNVTSNTRCLGCRDPQGIAFKLHYDIRDETTGIWSQLILIPPKLQFGLPTQFSCPISGFIYFNSSFGLQGISMTSTCIDLKLGIFPIMNLQNQFYISNDCGLQGILCDLIDSSTIDSNVSIYIWSMFPHSIPEIRLGHFMSLLPSNGNYRLGIASVISTNTYELLAKLFQLRVSILNTTLTVKATIDQTGLYFNDAARIFGGYPVVLIGHVAQSSDWNEALLHIFGRMQGEFTDALQQEVEKYFNFFVNRYQERTESSRLNLQRAQEQLDAIQNTNMNNHISFNRSQSDYNDALFAFFIANQTLQSIQDMVDQASEDVTDLRMRLDNLCTIKVCPEQCIPAVKCKTCSTNVTTPIQDTCTVTCTKYRQVKRHTGYRSVYKWGWFKVERCKSSCICFFWKCWTKTRCKTVSVCKRYLAMEPVYRMISEPYSSICQKPCQRGSETSTIEASCCASVGCNGGDSENGNEEGSSIPDPICINMNKMCERTRQMIFDALEAAEDNSATLLNELQDANRNVSIATLRVMRYMATLITSETLLGQSSKALEEAQMIHQIAESAYQQVLSDNGDIQIFIDLRKTTNSTMFIDISNITFNITIVTESPTSLLLDVSYHVPLLNQTSTTQVIVDFKMAEISLRNAAVFIVESIFLSRSRSSRSIKIARQASANGTAEPVDSNQAYFEQKCTELQNLQEYITVLNDSTITIVNMAISTMESVTLNMQSVASITESSMELFSQPQSINTTAIASDFNVTINSTTAEPGESETELELINLLQNLGNASGMVSQSVEVDSFRSWLLQMQDLHNRTATAAGFECFGFSDCLSIVTDVTEELLITSPSSIATSLLDAFPLAKIALLSIVQSTNNTIMDVSEKLQKFYAIIGDYQLTNYYCAQPPVIIEQPPQRTNPREGFKLQLVCNASSNYPISYKWKRDGIELVNYVQSTLIIDNIQLTDSGNYTCEATNHIGTVETIEVSVEVQQPPEFFLEPDNLDVYLGDWNGATFQCNATSWPYPGFTWHFKPKDSDGDFMIIENEVDNEYTIELPQLKHEGLYYCSASNEQATIQSRIAELTVLESSTTQMSRKFTVNFTYIDSEVDYQDNNDTMDDYLADEELINATVQSFIDLINNSIDLLSTNIQDVEIMEDGDEFVISFSLISKYFPYPETSLDVINQVVPMALVEWATVREELEEWITGDNITINSSGFIYTSDPSSVVTDYVQQTCPSGRQISLDNNFLCANCRPGTYQTTRVDTQLSDDDAQSNIIVPQCIECPVGYYQPNQGQISCDKCPPGSTSLTEGSRSCVLLCPPNYYSSTGYEPCSICPQGSYTLINGSTACINCSMSSSNVPTSLCPVISSTRQTSTPSPSSIFINQTSTMALNGTLVFTGTASPTAVNDSPSHNDGLSDSEVVGIAVSVPLVGIVTIGVLILVVIMLVIRQKRKAQYDVTGKSLSDTLRPLAVKSFNDKNGSELVFPNPTYRDCENHNNEFDQKAD